MRRYRTAIAVLLIAVLTAIIAVVAYAWRTAPAATVMAVDVPRRQAGIGDAVPMVVRVRVPWRDQIREVTAADETGGLVLIEKQITRESLHWGYSLQRVRCSFQGVSPGVHDVPALRLTTAGGPVAAATDVTIELTPSATTPPAPVPAPALSRRPAADPPLGYILIGMVVLALVLGVAARVRPRPEPEPPPAAQAAAALRALAPETRQPAEFYQELSDILRQYLEAAWKLPGGNPATQEILARLDHCVPPMAPPLQAVVEDLLNTADRVKFAGLTPAAAGMLADRDAALDFVADSERALCRELTHA